MNDSAASPANGARATRVLIIEDEPLVAENLRADLIDAGFDVVGVAPKLERALRLIEEANCDIAIVDANLAGVSAAPAAAALTARNLPFVVLSGYARGQLSSEFATAAFVQKPCRMSRLLDEIRALLPPQ